MEEVKTVNIGEALADYIESQGYGTVVHYQDIEHVTRERRGTHRYYNAISKAKKLLVQRGKAVKSIGGGDYQVLYPGDYSSAYSREVRLAKNHIKTGGKIIKGAPIKDMTESELQTFNAVSDFHRRIDASIRGQFVEVKRLTGNRHPLELAK